MSKITAKDAVRELWYRGILQYKLHEVQKKMLSSLISQNQEVTTFLCSRRLGKSYLLCLLALEKCLQTPNSIVKYVCPKKSQVKTILGPIMRDLLTDCPAELKPEYKANDYLYQFPNGSQIQMSGTDNGHHETMRGGKSDLWIVDEAGFCDELKYVVNTILAPTTDTTGGRGIISSTPSKESDHEFITEFLKPAEVNGTLIKYTIYDNPKLSPQKIREIINRYPDKEKDPEFRREYLCEVINNSELTIVPEFTAELKPLIVKEVERPPFYDAYVSMDIGFKDLTVVLFAYYDFKNARLVVEDEFVLNGQQMLADKFALAVKRKEEFLWTNQLSGEFKAPLIRVSDNNNLIFLNELTYRHNLTFLPTRKDNKEAALNEVRIKIAGEQILIHPRCKSLIYHLENGTWSKNKKDFARSPDAGHYDAIDSLIYMVRNVQWTKNPYPPGYMGQDIYQNKKPNELSKGQQSWANLFKARSSLK